MNTHRLCCCGCGDKPCVGDEFRYPSTSGSCAICALGETSYSAIESEVPAPSFPQKEQGSDPGGDWITGRHPENLSTGNICWETNPTEYSYPGECDQDYCWPHWPMGNKIPKPWYYQYSSPQGHLPWSPQVFKDWIDNWESPLVPKGDCSMHCTEENIGCHSLAFVGAVGRDYGVSNFGDEMPVCGADKVTVPPEGGENNQNWEWIRNWVKSGGKLVIMGEAKDSLFGSCMNRVGFFRPGGWYDLRDCSGPDCPENSFSESSISLSGNQITELLLDFAYYAARNDDEEEPTEWVQVSDEPPINQFENDNDLFLYQSCCQKTKYRAY
mgnify:FL=1